MDTFTNGLHPRNKLVLYLGKLNDNCFDINLGEELQERIVNFFKPSSKKVIHQQCKYYYYDDLKYIITQNGIHKCMKNKIHKYSCSNNAMICSLQEISVPIETFPPITGYHDTRIIERSIFQHKCLDVEVMNVVYNNGIITHECSVIVRDLDDPLFKSFIAEFNYDLSFEKHTTIDHGNNNVLSII